jgi:hypothetical protein
MARHKWLHAVDCRVDSQFFLRDLDLQLAFWKDSKGPGTGLLVDRTGRPH